MPESTRAFNRMLRRGSPTENGGGRRSGNDDKNVRGRWTVTLHGESPSDSGSPQQSGTNGNTPTTTVNSPRAPSCRFAEPCVRSLGGAGPPRRSLVQPPDRDTWCQLGCDDSKETPLQQSATPLEEPE